MVLEVSATVVSVARAAPPLHAASGSTAAVAMTDRTIRLFGLIRHSVDDTLMAVDTGIALVGGIAMTIAGRTVLGI